MCCNRNFSGTYWAKFCVVDRSAAHASCLWKCDIQAVYVHMKDFANMETHKLRLTYLFLINQLDALIIPILFCYKTLHVSGIFSAHRQEFSAVHSALVSFMQVFDDRLQTESGWSCVRSYVMHQPV